MVKKAEKKSEEMDNKSEDGDSYYARMCKEIDNIPLPEVIRSIDFSSIMANFLGEWRDTFDPIKQLKWRSKTDYTLTLESTFNDCLEHGIPFIDFCVARNLKVADPSKEIIFTADESFATRRLTISQIYGAYGLFLYLLISKDDPTPDTSIPLPNIAHTIFRINSHSQYRSCISVNNLKEIDLNFIFEKDWSWFPGILQEKLSFSISGFGIMKIFSLYDADREMNEAVRKIYLLVKKVSMKGIFLEYHPRLNPKKDLKLSRNLEQLIFLCYTNETIDKMIEERMLFKKPLTDISCNSFYDWDEKTFDFLKTPISRKFTRGSYL